MLQFIVLGQIPGTSVQIDFDLFLLAVCGLLTVFLIWLLTYSRHVRRVKQLLNILSNAL